MFPSRAWEPLDQAVADYVFPRITAEQAMQEGLFNLSTEYVLPNQVPARLVPEIKAASALCKIKGCNIGTEH